MRIRLAGLGALVVLSIGVVPEKSTADVMAQLPNCGIYSAVNLARYWGKTVNEADIVRLSQLYSAKEVSLFDVQQALKSLGLETEGEKITVAELQARKRPFISAVPGHFKFVETVGDSWVRCIDNNQIVMEPRTEFEQEYAGIALTPAPVEAKQGLELSTGVVDWGKIPTGVNQKETRIEIRNNSEHPISILDISTSCDCMTVSHAPSEVGPHEAISLHVSAQLPNFGNLNQRITISSSGAMPHQSVRFLAHVDTDVRLSSSQLRFGEVAPLSESTQTLSLRDDDQKLQPPLTVSTTEKSFRAHLTPQLDHQKMWEINVALVAPQRFGDVQGELLVTGKDKGGRVIHIPLHARVVPPTRAVPEQIVFGSLSPEVATRHFQVLRADRKLFEIRKVSSPAYLRCRWEPSANIPNQWDMEVAIDPRLAPMQVSDSILISTQCNNREEIISVPVLALNEKGANPPLPGAVEAALLPRAEDGHDTEIGLPLPSFQVGQEASDFRSVDSNDNPWHLIALRGQKNVLLTFFPKCFTGGCANHLSSLRDHKAEFDALGVQILAVSTDAVGGPQGQRAFAEQWKFNFPLIPDIDRKLCKLFGTVQNDDERSARMTVLIDKQGVVRFIDTHVNVQTHAMDMLAKIRELGLDR